MALETQSVWCLYPYKRCLEPRAIKPSGQLHKLCEHHRRQANKTQQRLEYRKRLRQLEEMQIQLDEELKRNAELEALARGATDASISDEGAIELTDEEMNILLQMLSD
ncbi:hypothetical protein Poli38472_001865 [Pythium oligandrum]|uniref:Uncharacterized protein n=1 Tax=Pythium oligandrum TaxID=41045 RepID=A0A8K1CUX7_PYTOL|nr:hypothetical protein Poli38472_001865 [Pythium oligandrum]|eukprot:TMW69709.1 hypothetical protein Poli38472_001865 [Pythium oligandrum]